jgi:hypothetical protein
MWESGCRERAVPSTSSSGVSRNSRQTPTADKTEKNNHYVLNKNSPLIRRHDFYFAMRFGTGRDRDDGAIPCLGDRLRTFILQYYEE